MDVYGVMLYKISIVMATFNGEKYIEEQLMSIFNQSLAPDEVIICDDCSIDNTIDIVCRFIKDRNLTNWQLHKNSKNLGWRENFINGFKYAKGDIIFCADQDDIWNTDKLYKMVNLIKETPNIQVLGCNMRQIIEKGTSLENKKKARRSNRIKNNNKKLEKVNFEEGLASRRQGCATCFKKELLPLVYIVWDEILSHDGVVWALGIINDTAYIYNEELMSFRRHPGNSTPSNIRTKSNRLLILQRELIMLENIINAFDEFEIKEERKNALINRYGFFKKRINSIKSRSIISLIKLFTNEPKYSFKSCIADIVSSLR